LAISPDVENDGPFPAAPRGLQGELELHVLAVIRVRPHTPAHGERLDEDQGAAVVGVDVEAGVAGEDRRPTASS
jgi:hypothetical protein